MHKERCPYCNKIIDVSYGEQKCPFCNKLINVYPDGDEILRKMTKLGVIEIFKFIFKK